MKRIGLRSKPPLVPPRVSGFTLVEILIVLVVMAILAGILLPVVARVRESSHNATCASNLKQIGVAIQMYAADHNRFYPHHNNPFTGIPVQCAWADRLMRYVKSPSLFECPTAEYGDYVPGCPTDSKESDDAGFLITYDGSYSLNRLGVPLNPIPHEVRFQHPTDTISVLDGRGSVEGVGHYPIPDVDTLTKSSVTPRHSNGCNVLFLDGHVKWRSIKSLVDRRLWIAANRVPD